MRIRNALLVFMVATGLAIAGNVLLAQQTESAAIEQIARQVGDAYNKKDLATFEKICDPNILTMEQGGETVGWAEFREACLKEWESATDFFWDLGKIAVHPVGKDFAWVTSEGSFKGKMKDGTQVHQSALTTFIFEKKGGAWKVVHTHHSFAPIQK